MSYMRNLKEIGSSSQVATATLYVCPEGDGTDGLTWDTAYTTIQAALTAASTDGDECTLINISPHTTNYNINTTGYPTFTGNYILRGSETHWAKIKNEHADVNCILKFTGKTTLENLNFNLGSDNDLVAGIIMTFGACWIRNCQFVGEDLGSAATALWFDGAAQIKHETVYECSFKGHVTHMTAIKIDTCGYSQFERIHIHDCLTGIHIVDAASDGNTFFTIDIGGCATGIDIDAGNGQHFINLVLHNNIANVDDSIGDHHWYNPDGQFEIKVMPDDFTGVTVTSAAGANAWGSYATVYTNATGGPFRVVGVFVDPTVTQNARVELYDSTAGKTFDDFMFAGSKQAGAHAPSGTEFVFNAGTVIQARTKDESGSDNVEIWLQVQEI